MKKILSLMICLLMLTGCSTTNRNNIINLLSSPKLSERESRIITAINDYLGQDITLKYPKNGENLSPVQLVDVDYDGTEEAVVMYTSAVGGTVVRLALLDQTDAGWNVVRDVEGYGSEIYSISFGSVISKENMQIVVGYTFAGDSEILLTVHDISDADMEKIYTVSCQEYALHDITGDGMCDIVYAAINAGNQRTRIKAVSAHYNGYLTALGTTGIAAKNVEVTNICFSHSDFAENDVILVDYEDNYHRVYTQAMCFDGYNMTIVLQPDVVQKIWYFDYELNSRDTNGDGYVETPTVIDDGTPHSHNLKQMEWTCFLTEVPQRTFYGVCEANSGTYFPLPDEWLNNIYLENGREDDTWNVVQTRNDEVLVRFRLMAAGEEAEIENTITVSKGTLQVKIIFHEDVTPRQRIYISQGLMYMK